MRKWKWQILSCVVVVFIMAIQMIGMLYLNNKIRYVSQYKASQLENIQREMNQISDSLLHIQLAMAISDSKSDMQKFYVADGYANDDAYIAHGGGVGKFTYTNSKEAVEDSLNRGFRFVEIDMIKTADNHILGAHDWDHFNILTKYRDIYKNSLWGGHCHRVI